MAVRISVYVQPRASRTEFAGRHGADIKIRLRAAPVDEAANEELIAFLAQQLGISRRHIRLKAGARSRRKILEFIDPPVNLAALLEALGSAP